MVNSRVIAITVSIILCKLHPRQCATTLLTAWVSAMRRILAITLHSLPLASFVSSALAYLLISLQSADATVVFSLNFNLITPTLLSAVEQRRNQSGCVVKLEASSSTRIRASELVIILSLPDLIASHPTVQFANVSAKYFIFNWKINDSACSCLLRCAAISLISCILIIV